MLNLNCNTLGELVNFCMVYQNKHKKMISNKIKTAFLLNFDHDLRESEI